MQKKKEIVSVVATANGSGGDVFGVLEVGSSRKSVVLRLMMV
jgi:hypothetical protein